MTTTVIPLSDTHDMGPPPAGMLSIPVFRHGTLDVRVYAPPGEDPQTPHAQDEVYVIGAGSAVFVDPDGRREVAAGDFIFVAAHVAHHFEALSEDFLTWVLFYGPDGGESA